MYKPCVALQTLIDQLVTRFERYGTFSVIYANDTLAIISTDVEADVLDNALMNSEHYTPVAHNSTNTVAHTVCDNDADIVRICVRNSITPNEQTITLEMLE